MALSLVKPVRKVKPASPSGSRFDGYLLAWTGALSFCGGLVGLAVSPAFEVVVPRGLILAWGAGCTLAALLAPLLSRPGVVAPASGPFSWIEFKRKEAEVSFLEDSNHGSFLVAPLSEGEILSCLAPRRFPAAPRSAGGA
jgi:hypothetical protein